MQLQFVAIFTHQFQLLFTECDYPKGFMVWIGLHGVMFLFLFSDFYKQAYSKRKARRAAEAQNKSKYDALVNGANNGSLANGHHLYQNDKLSNGDLANNNQGACMVSFRSRCCPKRGARPRSKSILGFGEHTLTKLIKW